MSKKIDLFEENTGLDSNLNKTTNSDSILNSNNSFISFKNATIIALIVILIQITSIFLLENNSFYKLVFSDMFMLIIEILIVLILFYTAKKSKVYGRNVQIAWTFLSIALLCYALGDVIWVILELVLLQRPFPSIADIFYIIFYPLFALGIWYLPRKHLSRDKKLKLIIDITITIITIFLILLSLFILPFFNSNQDMISGLISVSYIIGDILIFLGLLRILFNNYKNIYLSSLTLLAMSIISLILTDIIFSYYSIYGTYLSGGFLDIGWTLSFIFIGLAAILQINSLKQDNNNSYIILLHNLNFSWYLPIFGVAITYILLIWAIYNLNHPSTMYIAIGFGIIITLVILRQAITLIENRNLYLAAKNEIISRQKSETHYKTIFENNGTALMIADEDTVITKVNSEFEKFMGYSKDEVENKMKWTSLVATEEYLNKMLKYHTFRRTKPGSAPRNYETQFINKKGEVKDVFMTASLIPKTKKSVASLLDITDKKKSRVALRESKARLKIAMDLAKLVSWQYDVKSDMFTFDDQFYALYGTSIEKEGGTKMSSAEYARRFIPPEDSSLVAKEIVGALETEDPDYYRNVEHRIIRADGEVRFIIVRFGIIKDDEGNTIMVYGANQDITERKKSEESIKTSLEEKETLLKEVHHRVKNNMQIISSLLSLQSSYLEDEDAVTAFNESQGRIMSMSLVHEALYLSNNLSRIDFEHYIQKLVMGLIITYNAHMIDVKFKIESIAFNIETAIPCGLIINELVTNSIKHAFPDNKGIITIKFTQKSNKYKLVINDNGIGLPDNLFNESSNSLGLHLVKMLVSQLDGELKIDNINGTTFTIIFEELVYKERL